MARIAAGSEGDGWATPSFSVRVSTAPDCLGQTLERRSSCVCFHARHDHTSGVERGWGAIAAEDLDGGDPTSLLPADNQLPVIRSGDLTQPSHQEGVAQLVHGRSVGHTVHTVTRGSRALVATVPLTC